MVHVHARNADGPRQASGWGSIRCGRHTLIAAPTGSGKTLAAFLIALDELFREGLAGELTDETRVIYVSPLKAPQHDIHKNLPSRVQGSRQLPRDMGLPAPASRQRCEPGTRRQRPERQW
jgi:ATP-dependent Lhr-like helicase